MPDEGGTTKPASLTFLSSAHGTEGLGNGLPARGAVARVSRRATTSDLDHLLGLCAEFCAVDRHPFDLLAHRQALEPLLVDDSLGFVLVDDGGYAVVTWGWSLESGGRDALLDELYVRDRGHGHGRRLLDRAIDEARAGGARRVFLETERPNRSARRFYDRAGFVTEDSVWMSLDLDADPRDPSAPGGEHAEAAALDGDLVTDVEETPGRP